MSESSAAPHLLIHFSTNQETTYRIDLRTDITCMGRPESHETGPQYIDLGLDTISRQHARIVRQGDSYILENWRGRGKIGIYEQSLVPGDTHILRHCDIFRIPDVEGAHARLMFLLGTQTRYLPLEVEYQRPQARVFGEEIPLAPLEHRLLSFLHQHAGELCRYDQIIDHLWEDTTGRKQQLEVLLSTLRKKIRSRSGDFSFMSVYPSEGICLVL